MKRKTSLATIGIALLVFLSGCGNGAMKAVQGTWYGDKPDTLILKDNGQYTSTWLGTGKFTVEGKTLRLDGTGMAEGTQKELVIGEADGNKILLEAEQGVSYFLNVQDADAAIKKREDTLRAEEIAMMEKELDTFKEDLIGTWEWSGYSGEVTFKSDGTISGTVSGMKPGTYEVVDMQTIKIIEETREYTERINLTKTDGTMKLMFGTLNLVKK